MVHSGSVGNDLTIVMAFSHRDDDNSSSDGDNGRNGSIYY